MVRLFSCQVCGQRTYFLNVRCEQCGTMLGFLAGRMELHALQQAEGQETPDDPEDDVWAPVDPEVGGRFRRCGNWIDHDVCNWMVPSGLPERYCTACRLNEVIPDLGQPGNLERWARLEAAKRRVVYNLLHLGLTVVPRSVDPERGLAFRFMADTPGEPVLTGHAGGVVTINVTEADDAVRERRRVELYEPYRTLVGHLRHELGHYWWDRLVASDEDVLERFRALFGDERESYQEALQRHYDQGPPADWPDRFVTAYATMHPWEDWAETWAHYLHMCATLETAESLGVDPVGSSGASAGFWERFPAAATASAREAVERLRARVGLPAGEEDRSFEDLLARWVPLTTALNELNRSMGTPDPYPFVLSSPAIEKLQFVHEVVAGDADGPDDEAEG